MYNREALDVLEVETNFKNHKKQERLELNDFLTFFKPVPFIHLWLVLTNSKKYKTTFMKESLFYWGVVPICIFCSNVFHSKPVLKCQLQGY